MPAHSKPAPDRAPDATPPADAEVPVLRYLGRRGAHVTGYPARDITRADALPAAARRLLLASGLYEDPAAPGPPTQDAQAPPAAPSKEDPHHG